MKKRSLEIDMLRGIAIIAMILIHTCYYFLSDKTALFIWNWSQFAVPVFVFCSSYLFFQKTKDTPALSFAYFKKRITRLVYPYYIFLLFFIPVVFLLTPEKINAKYIVQSIFLIGGVDVNWLILLFVYITIILPIISIFYYKYRLLFIIYSLISVASSVSFIFYKLPVSYKYTMWLSWSVIPIFALFFVLHEHKNKFLLFLTAISGIVFTASYYVEIIFKHNLGMFENKYPPTIYFLSYGAFLILLLYFLSKFLIRNNVITKIVSFFSIHSYSIYFIHYTILIILASYLKLLKLSWVTYFLAVLLSTVAIQMGINKIRKPKETDSSQALQGKL